MTRHPSSSPVCDTLVVGAGPAGMMAAISAALRGASVTLCEQLAGPGMKLLATGGGRCNLANTLDSDLLMQCFGKNGRFMQPALSAMNGPGLRSFLAGHGLPTVAPDGFHVFPASNSSATVLHALWKTCADVNVGKLCGIEAMDLIVREQAVAGLQTSSGPMAARNIVLATGGKSYPNLGATGSGYGMATRAGHTLIDPLPVLVPLTTRETWPRTLAGVSLKRVRAWIDLPRQNKSGCTGDMLFTRSGVSGPVILDLSRDVVPLLRQHGEVPVRLDLQPETSAEQWNARFDEWPSVHARKKIANLLDQHLPASLAKALLHLAGIPEGQPVAAFSRPQRESLRRLLTELPLAVVGAGGFDNAMVTRGGVSLREVDPKTLQSRKIRGLYFAGEILDLDGPCGGYNLQWAFSSGWLAGLCAGAGRASVSVA